MKIGHSQSTIQNILTHKIPKQAERYNLRKPMTILTLSQTSPGFYLSTVQILKTLREKEKLLVMSNFSFSHSVFYPF